LASDTARGLMPLPTCWSPEAIEGLRKASVKRGFTEVFDIKPAGNAPLADGRGPCSCEAIAFTSSGKRLVAYTIEWIHRDTGECT
jgi:hypothetical protein